MNLTSIEIRYLVNEISDKIKDYYISNIYGITKDSLLFKLHHPQKQEIFLMLSTFGLWLTEIKIQQIEPNKLTKRLRNDLLRLKISKIQQLGAERIVYITFSGFGKEFIIVAEFFGDGNIILCNSEMKILALHHSLEVRHRTLKVGTTYVPPPQNSVNIFELSQSNIDEIQNSDMPCAKWIGRKLGLSSKYVDEIFKLAEIDPKLPGKQLTSIQRRKLFNVISDLIEKVVSGTHTPIIVKDDKRVEVYPLKLSTIKTNFEQVSSFNQGLDIVFSDSLIEKGKSLQSSTQNRKIQQLENQLEEQNKAINLVKEKSQAITSVANLLFSLTSKGITSINDDSVKEQFDRLNASLITEKGNFLIKIMDEKIKINPNSSLPSIASTLFNEAKKQTAAITSIEKLRKKTIQQIQKLKNSAEIAKESVTFSPIRKKNWYERYRWFYTSEGFLAIGGRDASSNSSIIRKHLDKNDKVFHAEIFGSPFFVLKNCPQFRPASFLEVAQATVCFSRAWREAMHGLSAYWVNPEQVKKAAPSGQFLPKGSFSIIGQKNFIKVPSLKLAIGILKQDDHILIASGPPDAIKKHTMLYAFIEPGGGEITDTAKKLRMEFIKIDEQISTLSLDEFVRVLPSGKSHITKISSNNDE